MAIRIGSNITSLVVQRSLASASSRLEFSGERLSSGLRINRASDDSAGLAISSSLRTDARVYNQAVRNVNDGISILNIASGALGELSGIVGRMMELSEQSSNGVYGKNQRRSLHKEAEALSKEFNRIIQSTSFNGISILNQSDYELSIQAGYGTNGILSAKTNSNSSRKVGTGSFTSNITFTAGGGSSDVQSADFNNDGILDLANVIDATGNIKIRLGNGDGSFTDGVTLAPQVATGRVLDIRVADVNNDGILDVLSTNTGSTFNVFLGSGDGTFSGPTSFSYSGTTNQDGRGLTTGDFNGDGKLDVAVANFTGTNVSILYGNGDGSFGSATTISFGGTAPSELAAIDTDGDGKDELVVATFLGVYVVRNSGSSLSSTLISGSTASRTVSVGDLNGDGILDIVSGGTGAEISVYLGNANGTFGSRVSYATSAANVQNLILSDMNGDGYLDITGTVQGANSIATFIGKSDGTFNSATYSSSLTNVHGLTVGDFNGDGVNDVISSSGSVSNLDLLLANTRQTNEIQVFDLTTQASSLEALEQLTLSLERLSRAQGTIGSFQSRLGVTRNVLGIFQENLINANSRIIDTDIAEESATYISSKIRQQIAASLLGQANQNPNLALQLLQN
jgi:flagellin-like hook-associated protein FlgL